LACQFNEKDFEKKIDFALGRYTNVPVFGPDQVAEALLGFDSAWMLPRSIFYLLGVGFRVRPSRSRRREYGVRVDRKLLDILPPDDRLPAIRVRFNLFLQYKIPDYLTGHNSSQWPDWKRPYFRVDLTAHQQSVLEKIDERAAERAIAAYCMPAFTSKEHLHDFTEVGSLIDNSHFTRAGLLKAHKVYTYVDAQGLGKAHSETSEIRPLYLADLLTNGGGFEGEGFELAVAAQLGPVIK